MMARLTGVSTVCHLKLDIFCRKDVTVTTLAQFPSAQICLETHALEHINMLRVITLALPRQTQPGGHYHLGIYNNRLFIPTPAPTSRPATTRGSPSLWPPRLSLRGGSRSQ